MKTTRITFIIALLLCTLFNSCKKDGEPFNVDFILSSSSKIKSIKIVEYKNLKKKEIFYNNTSPINKAIEGFYKFQISGTINLPNNVSTLIKIETEEPNSNISYKISDTQTNSKSNEEGKYETNFLFLNKS